MRIRLIGPRFFIRVGCSWVRNKSFPSPTTRGGSYVLSLVLVRLVRLRSLLLPTNPSPPLLRPHKDKHSLTLKPNTLDSAPGMLMAGSGLFPPNALRKADR